MKITYRPEIDGLRAIAIIFIILSHFKQLNFVSGGVNIFFVISGYLITHIFLNQQLDISKFYKTRFLKLYPNIFIVSLIILILFFFIGDFVQWSVILRSFISTIIGLFNFYLIKVGNVYGQENYINPFLPFWAFCVIVQFYFIFPIVLKIIFFIKKKFNFNDDFIIISLFTISIVLFLFYFYFRTNNIFFSFYSPFSRYWQFILGSCLYFIIQSKKKLYFNNLSIYFALILIIIWQLNLESFYGWKRVQILLTISTLLFLYSTNTNIFNKILSIKPLTFLGKVSFELYLIHMAVIYFISLWFEQAVFILSLILLFITTFLFIKFFTQRLLQKIIFIFNNKVIIFSSLFIIFINLVGAGGYSYDKNFLLKKETQFKNIISAVNLVEKTQTNFKNKYKHSNKSAYDTFLGKDNKPCYREFNEEFLQNCTFINIENNNFFFLIGGSQISTLGYNLKQRLQNFSYSHISFGNFIYLPDFDIVNSKNNNKDKNFGEINDIVRKILLSVNKKSIVLIGARYPLFINQRYFDNKEGGIEGKEWVNKFEHDKNLNIKWQVGFKNSIEELSKNKNISVILVYTIPEVGFSVIDRLKNYKFFSNKLLDTSFDVFKERNKSTFELLDSIKGENIYRVYPHKLFCDTTIKNRCVTHDDMNTFYSDSNHPSIKGAEMINDLIMKEIENIELKSSSHILSN